MENGEPASKKRKLDEPYVRDKDYILRKHKGKPVSLTLHLYPTHFKFEGQDGSFPYDGESRFILQHMQHNTVPHEMIEELLSSNVPWYDGCLIVEVHNHRNIEANGKARNDSANEENAEKFGMHNWNNGLTPSPMVPYPSEAKQAEEEEKRERTNGEMAAPEKPKEKEGPRIFTKVLFPTDLSKHHELLLLANTPASEVRTKKRGSDGATPSSAHPPTPSLSIPPTPITGTARGSSTQPQKMCIEEADFYTFQGELLVATEPPLYLEPVDNPQDAQKVLDLLSNSLHQEQPPSPKTRKRTTAEVAADDAQRQETERRMLLMDERIKPAGAGAAQNDNQTAPSSLTFSRFKTIDMVRQKLEDADRQRKEDEFRASAEKKAQEEQAAMAQRAAYQQHQQRQREILIANQQQGNQHQNLMIQQQQQQNQIRARAAMAAAQQQAQMNPQNHAHPQQNAMMQAQQQNFPTQVSMPQSSPIVRNPTPMMNSSPMMPQGGFPMAQTSSQGGGAGSPPRPQAAVVQNPMARQISQQQQQQQQGSRTATPQMQQGTPAVGQAMPNRQMAQTPRMPPSSPAPGMQQATPTMQMQTPHMVNQNQFSQAQLQMLQQQQQRNAMAQGQQNQGQAGSPNGTSMTPEQFQSIQRQQQQVRSSTCIQDLTRCVMSMSDLDDSYANLDQQQMVQRTAILQAQARAGDQNAIEQLQRMQQAQHARNAMQQQQRLMEAQRNAQMAGQAGSPGAVPQQTPQMGHAHPQQQHPGQQQGNMPDPSQMTLQQQQQLAQARAQQLAQSRANHQNAANIQARQQISQLIQRYGNLNQIPQQVIANLPPATQQNLHMIRQNQAQRQMQAQQAAAAQQQAQQNGATGEQVPGGQGNPEYMQQLRNSRAMLGQHMQQQQQQAQQGQGTPGGSMAGMNGMTGLSFQMGGINQNAAFGNQQNGNDLTQQFAAMQNALARGQQQGGQGQGMQ
jgi:transcription factor SPT20